jgi:hypothetical protein
LLKYYFASIISVHLTRYVYEKKEGSGAGPGSVPLTNGSGSGRPKNMRILRFRIPNTGKEEVVKISLALLKKEKNDLIM